LRSSESFVAERAAAMVGRQRALVIGLAREGLDLTRFLMGHGGQVVVSDQRPSGDLAEAVSALGADGLTPDLRLGGHDLSHLDGVDIVYPSPGVPPEHALLKEARRRGVRISSLVELFFALCPAPILGITGSAGKSTTTSLVGPICEEAGLDPPLAVCGDLPARVTNAPPGGGKYLGAAVDESVEKSIVGASVEDDAAPGGAARTSVDESRRHSVLCRDVQISVVGHTERLRAAGLRVRCRRHPDSARFE